MRYYPALLDILDQNCLVVGGGAVAFRKVKTLLESGAVVTVVSPRFTKSFEKLMDHPGLTQIRRSYDEKDLDGNFLVIGATDDDTINRQISADARRRNMLCNIADVPDACNFILPAVVDRGDLIVAVSTSGKSPAFAKKLRKDLEKQYGGEYTEFLKLMGAIRKRLLATEHAPEAHRPQFERLIQSGLLDLVRDHRHEEIDRLLHEVFGSGYTYEALMCE